jgi:two-component system, chemotaxis family, sensor kinase CheA
MTSSDIGDTNDTFRQESQELLEELERVLLDLEHRPTDGDLIDCAFRALHTLKGSGAMFGFDRLAAFTHHVETAFDRVRKGEIKATADLIELTLAAKDRMRLLIEAPDEVDEASGEQVLARLQDVVAGASTDAAPADVAPAEGRPATWRVCFRLPVGAMSSGSNPLLMIEELHDLGEATVVAQTDSIPPLDALDPGECYVGWDVQLRTTASRETIEQVFLFLLDDMELSIERLEAPADAGYAEGGPLEESDDVPVVAEAPSVQPPPAEAAALQDEPAQKSSAAPSPEQTPRAASAGAKSGGSVRVPAERLDEMMDRVGELVIAQSRLKQLTKASEESQIKSVVEEIERLAGELQDITMGVRMVAIGTLFGRFRRLVHDISNDLGKEIELVTEGEETELDKTMIERLADPLVHLIRNSSDHGLETPTGRAEAGKPAKGRITLTARHAGAEVLISVRDDGRGLDRERIQARAEDNGLIAPGAKPADQDLFKLIFEPGFSTAKEVTNLSGRGVGMDVVKRTIDELRGAIDVRSQMGGGSEVTLRLPLTLAIIDGLLVRVGRSRYVIPLSAVEECVELTPEADVRSTGRSFLNIRDELVPFIRLRELFRSQVGSDPFQKVVIVSAGGARVGLVVDQVLGDHQTVIKSLSKLHSDVKSFSGATILGDGTVALILDVPQLVEDGQAHDDRFKAAS